MTIKTTILTLLTLLCVMLLWLLITLGLLSWQYWSVLTGIQKVMVASISILCEGALFLMFYITNDIRKVKF